MTPIDIHTHRATGPGVYASYGIHPWDTPAATDETLAGLRRALVSDSRVVAIGECGLDTLRGASLERQMELLEKQLVLSEELGLPVILHVVKAWNEIMGLRRKLKPTLPWVVHGFRGKPQLATNLLDSGFYISLGPRHNPDTTLVIPSDRLLIETDDDITTTIDEVAAGIPHYDPATTLGFLNLKPDADVTAVVNRG